MPVMCGKMQRNKQRSLKMKFYVFLRVIYLFFALLVYYLSEVFKVCLELCCFLELVLAETTI